MMNNVLNSIFFVKGDTSLHIAVKNLLYSNVYELVKNKVDLNARNVKNETPLSCALDEKYDDFAIFLIHNGAKWEEYKNRRKNFFGRILSDNLKLNKHYIYEIKSLFNQYIDEDYEKNLCLIVNNFIDKIEDYRYLSNM